MFLAVVVFSALAQDASGLKLSGSADLIGSIRPTGSGFNVREAEITLSAPVDASFAAQISAAAHPELGETFFELHEAFLTATGLIPGVRGRLGQFFLPIGRLNQFHRHEWPFSTTPLVQQTFLGSEGVIDAGLEVAYLLPLPFFAEVSAGVTSGYNFGHSHSVGSPPLVPTHFVRTTFFADLPYRGGAQLGLNYLGRVSSVGDRLQLLGVDLTAKWRAGRVLQFLFQTEGWQRILGGTREFSLYVFPQYGFPSGLSVGARLDYLTNLTLRDTGVSNWTESYGPALSFAPSEFSTFRLQYAWSREVLGTQATLSHLLTLQAVFQLGAHPAHDF